MRIFTTFFFALFSMALFSQNSKIYPKGKIILGEENTFVYEPTDAINIVDGVAAKYVYVGGYKNSPLIKKQNKDIFNVLQTKQKNQLLLILHTLISYLTLSVLVIIVKTLLNLIC